MKKLVSIFAAILITVILIVPASAKTLLLGDVDYDNVVTAKDARSILRAAAMLDSFTDEQNAIADVDQSGKVEAVDARLALRFAAQLEDLSEDAQIAADVDFDDKVTAVDARKILRVSAGLDIFGYE